AVSLFISLEAAPTATSLAAASPFVLSLIALPFGSNEACFIAFDPILPGRDIGIKFQLKIYRKGSFGPDCGNTRIEARMESGPRRRQPFPNSVSGEGRQQNQRKNPPFVWAVPRIALRRR